MAEWDIPLDQFFSDAEEEITDEVRGIIKDAAQFLVDITPVRTGRLRGGYQGAINRDPPFQRPPDDMGGQITISLIAATAEQFKLGDTFKIVNYTPYGPYVNDGTERMAGQFMIERTINHISG